jgi:hypothetical protein
MERLVGYLYDELPPEGRAAFEAHLATCATCRQELDGLRATRTHLGSWAPPEPDFGFRIVRGAPAAASAPAPGSRSWPRWGLAAAAVLLLAASAALANLEVRYDRDGFVVRTGWANTAPPALPPAQPAAVPVSASSEQVEAALQVIDARLGELERAKPAAAPAVRAAGAAGPSSAEIEALFKRLISESETRQQRELAVRVSQLWKDMEAVRANDLARVEQGFRQVQGLTDAELLRQRETLNILYANVSQRQR